MSRGNDAIPSWSGFNYQGKMMLLCIMEKIYSVIAYGKDLSKFEIELEKQEDYVFVEDGRSSQFYQVKATLSKSKWNEYEESLNKLIDHRNASDNAVAPCYLVVARPIRDWNLATNPYSTCINIYKYNGNEVKIDDVKGYICTEIEKILNLKGIKFRNIEAVYGNLCIFLEDKIAQMHLEGIKNRRYKIGLNAFFENALEAVGKIEAEKEYVIKEKVYEHMIKVVQKSLECICQQTCKKNYEDCEIKCSAKTACEKILELTDLRKYCKVINPSIVDEWEDEISYSEHFDKKEIVPYILGLFLQSKDSELIEHRDNSVGMRSEINPLPQGILIPTLLNLAETFATIENSTQNKLQALRDNTAVLKELLGNSITVSSNDCYSEKSISQAQITSAWESFDEKEINDVPYDIGFVTVKDLLKYFSDNGGNHE